ncbi:M48 family metalloprotease [Kangiella sp. HZ709]|uniref:M48 family metalloprotease n=1 Tax=Kangiella sp. HZ709 TaxID=2666328 RepID=UPI0012AF1E84|nr:M48 family metalloprotease [Kangiella sp. HZ709]MRX27221.1 M48 family metalloprotease [Kangiella sp. HZ709]
MRIGNRRLGRKLLPLKNAGFRGAGKMRLLIALAIGVFGLLSYCSSHKYNPVTGEKQYLSMTTSQEIAMGLQAVNQMAAKHGGLHQDPRLQEFLDSVCMRIIEQSQARETQWRFECHLLADPNVVNAFALPGGQMFITYALFRQLETEGQLAGVMSHEIAHVVARHSAQRIAKAQLTQNLIQAVLTGSDSQGMGQMASMVGNMINMKYGRDDELQSDTIGVKFMAQAGYNPHALKGVMRILNQAAQSQKRPEFFSTHPNPENRIEKIEAAINQLFPQGLPKNLTP